MPAAANLKIVEVSNQMFSNLDLESGWNPDVHAASVDVGISLELALLDLKGISYLETDLLCLQDHQPIVHAGDLSSTLLQSVTSRESTHESSGRIAEEALSILPLHEHPHSYDEEETELLVLPDYDEEDKTQPNLPSEESGDGEYLFESLTLPPPALAMSPVIERATSVSSSRKRSRRCRSPVPPPSPSNSPSSSVADGLASCGGTLKRMKAELWCKQHCSKRLQVCKQTTVRPGISVWLFK